MKQKIKKAKNIKNKLTPEHSEVLLEEMDSNIKLILESHLGLDKKIDKNHKGFQEFRKEVNFRFDGIDQRFNGVDSNFKTVFEYLSKIDGEILSIKIELRQVKLELKNKADWSFFNTLEKRIKKLEMNYTKLNSLILQQCG